MSGSSTYIPRGSSPLIKNSPAQLQYAVYALERGSEILARAVTSAINDEMADLEESLPIVEPAYEEILDSFSIEYDDETQEFVYVVAEEHADMARNVEYGTPSLPPSAPLRNAVALGSTRISQRINLNIAKEMGL